MTTLRAFLLALFVSLAALAPTALAAPDAHQGLGDDLITRGDLSWDIAPDPVPLASPHQEGCVTDLISTNFSSRGGEMPRMFVLHYTVSRNADGWSDVNAIRSWFSQSRAQASSNYIIDFEGNCKLIVPETAKAWTQGAFNPYAISIEFIAVGSESRRAWKQSAGLRKGAKVVADAMKRWNLPIRYVNPSGCNVPKGLTDHERLECGNTHTDVQPNFPYEMFLDLVKDEANPPKRYRFVMRGPDGQMLADSSPVEEGAAETRRLQSFLYKVSQSDDLTAQALRRLRRKGEVHIHREEVR